MLIDNRIKGKTPVVVVPASQWDKMRKAEMELIATSNTSRTSLETKPLPIERPPIIPIEGSHLIQFSNRTDSNLGGCSSIGVIEVLHEGTMDEALTILKNEAYRMNTNVLVPNVMEQTKTNDIKFANIQIEARMMKCPLKLARGN